MARVVNQRLCVNINSTNCRISQQRCVRTPTQRPSFGSHAEQAASAESAVKQAQDCLRDGAWVLQPDTATLNQSHAFASAWQQLDRRKQHREQLDKGVWCNDSRIRSMHVWNGKHERCASALQNALLDAFDGAFDGSTQEVSLFVLGDSIGEQIRAALRVLMLANPKLGGLRLASWDRSHAEISTRGKFIPASVQGNLDYLNNIEWPQPNRSGRAQVHVVLAQMGMHYNPWATCDSSDVVSRNGRLYADICKLGPGAFVANHTHPSRTTFTYQTSHFKTELLREGDFYTKARLANEIALPVMEWAAVPTVPLFTALADRASLHTDRKRDCTHWCNPSDATLFMWRVPSSACFEQCLCDVSAQGTPRQ